MKRLIITVKESVLRSIVDEENNVSLADKIKSETGGHYVVIGRKYNNRVMADIACLDPEALLEKIPAIASVSVVGIWNKSGVPTGISHNEEGERTGEATHPFNAELYIKHMPSDEDDNRPTEPKLMSNFSGWSLPEMG